MEQLGKAKLDTIEVLDKFFSVNNMWREHNNMLEKIKNP